MVEYSETYEQAAEHSRAALDMMQRRGIPPHPNNFMIWFHYFSGRFPDLKRAVDVLLDNGREFTEVRSAEIFQKYFTFDEEAAVVTGTAEKVERQLTTILKFLDTAENGAEAYGRALEAISGRVAESGDGPDLKRLVGEILSETRTMAEHNKSLEDKLSASSSEINQLKDDLDNVRREAMTDALTGIPNRKLFDSELRRVAADTMEKGGDLCLLMVDVDHFKSFNDTYGHQVGDQVLKLLAATLTENIKGRDTAARYGGEEFSVILPDTDIADAVRVAEGIRANLAAKRIINKKSGEELGQITVSIGAGKFVYGEPLGQFIHRADEALYAAKKGGRNRVVSEAELPSAATSPQ